VVAKQIKPSVQGNIQALVGWEGGYQDPLPGDQLGIVVVEQQQLIQLAWKWTELLLA
jgi:hypothetical protein